MTELPRPKPLPARPADDPPADPVPAAAVAATPPTGGWEERKTSEPEEAEVVGRGGVWLARVLGRAGRAAARSAPLLLVGFWERGSEAAAPALEGMVPGFRLADVPTDTLEEALAVASPPPGDRRAPFFEDVDPTRRSGSGSEY